MSIAINPMPAASSPDDAAAPPVATPDGNSFLPFESILDEQSSANQDADDVGETDAPLDVFDATIPASQPPIDSLPALLNAPLPSTRPLLRKDEIDLPATMQGSFKRDKPRVDPTVLLLQAAQNAIRQRDMASGPSTPAPSTSDVNEANDVGEADAALGILDAAASAAQPPVDSVAPLLTGAIPGTRPLLRKDEIDQSTTTQGSITRDKPFVDPTVLLLQATQNPVTELNMSPDPSVPAASTSAVKDANDVGEAVAPLDVFDAGLSASEPPIDSVPALLTASLPGTRPLVREDEIDQSTTTQGSIKEEKPAVDPTALLPLAGQNAVRQLDTSPAPSASAPSTSPAKKPVATEEPIRRVNNDELVPHLFTALTESDARAVLNADSDDAPLMKKDVASGFNRTSATPLTDLLINASEQNPQAEPLRVPDLPLPRTPPTAAPAASSMIDAIRLAINQGPQFDQDRGSAQSSTAGSDRRATKTAVVPAIHLTETVSFDAAVRQSAPSSVPPVTLPNEDGVMSSIVQSMRLQMRDGVGTAVVHLEPGYLGAVSISLRVENGAVAASLHAENPQVRAWMEANAPLLRESLAGQGLSLDRLLITDERVVDDQSQGRRQHQEQEQQAQQRPRRNGAATFEVVV